MKFTRPDRIFYLSGPHGSGKSTLVERLSQIKEAQIANQIAHMESLQDMVERAVWRVALHAIEHRQNMVKNEGSPTQVLIGDRCFIDDFIYWEAFVRLGWITREQYNGFVELTKATYNRTGTPMPHNVIMLVPPLNWNVTRVIERQKENGEIKWHEDDFGYLSVVNSCFQEVAAMPVKKWPRELIVNVLPVAETDLEKRVSQITTWINPPQPVRQATSFVEAGRHTYRSSGGTD